MKPSCGPVSLSDFRQLEPHSNCLGSLSLHLRTVQAQLPRLLASLCDFAWYSSVVSAPHARRAGKRNACARFGSVMVKCLEHGPFSDLKTVDAKAKTSSQALDFTPGQPMTVIFVTGMSARRSDVPESKFWPDYFGARPWLQQ